MMYLHFAYLMKWNHLDHIRSAAYLFLLSIRIFSLWLSLRGSISALMLDPPCVQRVFLERYASGLSRNYLPLVLVKTVLKGLLRSSW